MPNIDKLTEQEKKKLVEIQEKIKEEKKKLDLIKKQYKDYELRLNEPTPIKINRTGLLIYDRENKVIGHLKILGNMIGFNGSHDKSAKILFEEMTKEYEEIIIDIKVEAAEKAMDEFGKKLKEMRTVNETLKKDINKLESQLKQKTESAELFAENKEKLEKLVKELESRMNELEIEISKEIKAKNKAIEEITKLEREIITITQQKITESAEYKRIKQELEELKRAK